MSDSFATPWTVAHQAPLSMEFFKLEYWNGLPYPPPEDLPDQGTDSHVGSLPLAPPGKPMTIQVVLNDSSL